MIYGFIYFLNQVHASWDVSTVYKNSEQITRIYGLEFMDQNIWILKGFIYLLSERKINCSRNLQLQQMRL